MIPMGCSQCSQCKTVSEVYGVYPSCRDCVDVFCFKCGDVDTYDNESNRITCKGCTRYAYLQSIPFHKLTYDEREELRVIEYPLVSLALDTYERIKPKP